MGEGARERTGEQWSGSIWIVGAIVIVLISAASVQWWWQPRRVAAEVGETSSEALVVARGWAGEGASLVATGPARALAWRSPEACEQVYELRVDESFRDLSVGVFLGREEEHLVRHLAIGPHPDGPRGSGCDGVEIERIAGVIVGPQGPRWRELHLSRQVLGPAAPDAACRPKSWDHLEDALALAWPRLPSRTAQVGETWTGAAVEGRCHETACLDDEGRFDHSRPCRVDPWMERLVGEVRRDGERLAVIESRWTDGRYDGSGRGVSARRIALVSRIHGRPLRVRVEIEHGWTGVRRVVELEAIDDCPGALREARDGEARRLAPIRASLRRGSVGSPAPATP